MKYFGPSNEAKHLIGTDYVPTAKAYWGPSPLPKGAEIVGGYSDDRRAGALIRLARGALVCGRVGAISSVAQPKRTQKDHGGDGGLR